MRYDFNVLNIVEQHTNTQGQMLFKVRVYYRQNTFIVDGMYNTENGIIFAFSLHREWFDKEDGQLKLVKKATNVHYGTKDEMAKEIKKFIDTQK
jgi:hypothetical protein